MDTQKGAFACPVRWTAGGPYTVTATSGAQSGMAAVTVTSGGGDGGDSTATYIPYAAMPRIDGGARSLWIPGNVSVVKDVIGGDLVGFFKGSTSLHAAVSRNSGTSWAWVTSHVFCQGTGLGFTTTAANSK